MGHRSLEITADTPGHRVPGPNGRALDRLDDETGPKPGAAGGKEAEMTPTVQEEPKRTPRVYYRPG